MHILKSIYDSDKTLEDVEKEQIKLNSDLDCKNEGPPYYKSFEQLNTIEKVNDLYKSRTKVIQMFNVTLKVCLNILMS